MNPQVIRVMELAKANAVIDAESKYHGYGRVTLPEPVDKDALEYCINKDRVGYVHEESMWGTITRIALTTEGETWFYEQQPIEPPAQPTPPPPPARLTVDLAKRQAVLDGTPCDVPSEGALR